MPLHFGKTGSEAAWDSQGNTLRGSAAPGTVWHVIYDDNGMPARGEAATGLLDATRTPLAGNAIEATAAGQYEFYGPGEIDDVDPPPVTKYILANAAGDWLVDTTQIDEIMAWLRGRLAAAESNASGAVLAANNTVRQLEYTTATLFWDAGTSSYPAEPAGFNSYRYVGPTDPASLDPPIVIDGAARTWENPDAPNIAVFG